MPQSSKTDSIQKKTSYHHGNLRAAIIEAVAHLIGEQKALGFQLKEVAAIVGTSQPALYKHFANKHDLLVETAIIGYDLQKQFRDYAIEQAGPSPLAKALALGHAYVHFAQKHPGHFLLMKNLETDEILSSKRYQKQRDETLELVRGLISSCIAQDLFIKIDIDIAMTSLQATAFGLAHLYIGGQMEVVARDLYQDKNLVRRIFIQSMGGMLTPKGHAVIQENNADPFN